MPLQIIKRRSRGFICVNAHPAGCRRNVERWIAGVKRKMSGGQNTPKNVLVVGASTGYGLASRIAAAWGYGAKTLGVFFERPPEGDKTASAGHYNTVALHSRAKSDGLFAASINGDAFSDEVKRASAEIIRKQMAPVDLVIYSLASPRRTDPDTGAVYNSVLKPVGQPFTNRTIELDSGKVTDVTLQPATETEIADTVKVMGGDDWRRWIKMLADEKLLAPGARTLAYTYIGPEITWPMYRDGTIGRAKKDLERAALELDSTLANQVGGNAWISVNKAVVTQASSAIPVLPLYLSLLPKVMKQKNLEEGPPEQMRRLFTDFLCTGSAPKLDEARRVRLDDREMRDDVQAEVAALWPQVTTENLRDITDFNSFQRDFRGLFGFEVDGVDYDQPVETDLQW
ncbi:MAG TPA: enoyl-ACP reductase FabV [Candidatus Sulfotelmatobacter sp.]|jgi:enoyl-[acyl-carrier protein] reductase/trans-2-enoyl-CoA reductase (NAD+)|nr:enoyl-ACP reductase FabV [Candidatus Sulfotelmatobacter sp.]